MKLFLAIFLISSTLNAKQLFPQFSTVPTKSNIEKLEKALPAGRYEGQLDISRATPCTIIVSIDEQKGIYNLSSSPALINGQIEDANVVFNLETDSNDYLFRTFDQNVDVPTQLGMGYFDHMAVGGQWETESDIKYNFLTIYTGLTGAPKGYTTVSNIVNFDGTPRETTCLLKR
jgi:hypothetical protein